MHASLKCGLPSLEYYCYYSILNRTSIRHSQSGYAYVYAPLKLSSMQTCVVDAFHWRSEDTATVSTRHIDTSINVYEWSNSKLKRQWCKYTHTDCDSCTALYIHVNINYRQLCQSREFKCSLLVLQVARGYWPTCNRTYKCQTIW